MYFVIDMQLSITILLRKLGCEITQIQTGICNGIMENKINFITVFSLIVVDIGIIYWQSIRDF